MFSYNFFTVKLRHCTSVVVFCYLLVCLLVFIFAVLALNHALATDARRFLNIYNRRRRPLFTSRIRGSTRPRTQTPNKWTEQNVFFFWRPAADDVLNRTNRSLTTTNRLLLCNIVAARENHRRITMYYRL